MVYCVEGEVMDAVVDLRIGSPTYGQYELFELSAAKATVFTFPKVWSMVSVLVLRHKPVVAQ